MSIFFSPNDSSLGSLGIAPLISYPPLPNIIAEWAAILPLVCHLASQRDDYIITGEIALLGRLSIGLFPRLGSLSGLSRLLRRGTKFLDYASSRGGTGRIVWDINWGSVFPCANGAASVAIAGYLKSRNRRPLRRMPEIRPGQRRGEDLERTRKGSEATQSTYTSDQDEKSSSASTIRPAEGGIRRYQILHVYRFHCKQRRSSLRLFFHRLRLSMPFQILWLAILSCLAVLLGLFGTYGTAAMTACTAVSQVVAWSVPIRRPFGYLKNNEKHDACMLVASHENATEWHLYIGDRSTVDTLLNKPMFIVPEGRSAHLVASWFLFAHLLQLAVMTFVAAQKGWDGVCLVVFLATHRTFGLFLRGDALAHDWLEREGVDADVKSFEFSARYAMMGAIQIFNGNDSTRWMDDILVPHLRRDAWLQRLKGETPTCNFNAHDARWIDITCEASLASAEVLKAEFSSGGDHL